jgi:germination protein M
MGISTVGKMPVTLYYQDIDGYLIPVVKWIAKQQGIAGAAVNSLISEPDSANDLKNYGLYHVLSEGAELLGINRADDVLILDFNKEFEGFDSELSERNAVTSLVYTLTELDSVAGIKILINGHEKESLKYGTDISGVLERKDIFINPEAQANDVGSGFRTGEDKVDIYFFKKANDSYTYLLPVSMRTEDPVGGEMAAATMMQFLLKTNPSGTVYSEIPVGTALLDCSKDKGILNVDLSKSFLDYGGSSREEGILQQLLFTLKQDKDVEKVRILVEGTPAILPEGSYVSGGFPVPLYINDVMEK